MREFYLWSESLRIAIGLLILMVGFAQTLCLVLSYYNEQKLLRRIHVVGFESLILVFVLSTVVLYGKFLESYHSTVIFPMAKFIQGTGFAYLLTLSLLICLLRSLYLITCRYRRLSTGISALSIKDAIDSLNI